MTGKSSITDYAAGSWLIVAITGQFAFFLYLALFYAFPALLGNLEAWNGNMLLSQPPVAAGETMNTIAFGTHAIGAGIIALMGGLQLLPFVRRRFRTFHRWNGRVFLLTVIALSVSGYYLTWVRGPVPEDLHGLGTSVNGLLILSFVVLALRAALQKRFDVHERWAVRLFLVSNAQWFLRIGGFGYYMSMTMLGHEVAFDGWFFQFWTWGCFLVPLAGAELYFRTRRSGQALVRWTSAAVFVLAIPLTAAGILAFSGFTVQLLTGGG